MQRIFRRILTAVLIAIFLLSVAIVGAAVQVFDGTGQYIMSDFENHDIAKQRAQQRAEKDAQKKAGVALKTFSRSINSELADDEISAVMNNIIKISEAMVVPVPFEAEGEAGLIYKATIKAEIDTDGIYAWLNRNNKEKVTIVQQNAQLQDAIQKNDEHVEHLKEQYKRVKSKSEKDKIRNQMNNADREFLANQKFEEGNRLFYAKDFNGAIKYYTESIEINPNLTEAYNNRGVAYLWGLKEYESAVKDFDKAIQLDSNFTLAYNNRGAAYLYGLKEYELALKDFDKAIQLDATISLAYYNRGNAYRHLRQYEEAVREYSISIQLDPQDAGAYFNRGIAYDYLKQYSSAIHDYGRAIQLNPNHVGAYMNRGVDYKNLEQYDLAIQDYSKAIELDPNHTKAYYNRGNVYFEQKQYELALQDFSRAIQLNPNFSEAYRNRSITYQALGDEANAQADLDKAKSLGFKG